MPKKLKYGLAIHCLAITLYSVQTAFCTPIFFLYIYNFKDLNQLTLENNDCKPILIKNTLTVYNLNDII